MDPLLFGDIAPVLHEQGWGVPVPSSTEDKHPLISSWPYYADHDAAPEQFEIWAANHPGANTAIVVGLAAGVAWLDLDFDEPGVAAMAVAAANEHLGHATHIRIGREPRQVRAYRAADNVADVNLPGLELAAGAKPTLITVYGTHPGTGKPYLWPDQHLLDTVPADLPLITGTQVQAFLKAMEPFTVPRRPMVGAPLSEQPAAHLLRALGYNPNKPPLELWASALTGAVEGWRRNTMFGCVVAATMRGFSDAEIRAALLPVYLALHEPHEHRTCKRAFAGAQGWIRSKGYSDRAETERLAAGVGWIRRR